MMKQQSLLQYTTSYHSFQMADNFDAPESHVIIQPLDHFDPQIKVSCFKDSFSEVFLNTCDHCFLLQADLSCNGLVARVKGPSIYDVHTEGRGQAQVDACGRGRVQAPCERPHRKLKLESTDVILFSPHAKKLASFFTRISSLDRKEWKFFCNIN